MPSMFFLPFSDCRGKISLPVSNAHHIEACCADLAQLLCQTWRLAYGALRNPVSATWTTCVRPTPTCVGGCLAPHCSEGSLSSKAMRETREQSQRTVLRTCITFLRTDTLEGLQMRIIDLYRGHAAHYVQQDSHSIRRRQRTVKYGLQIP